MAYPDTDPSRRANPRDPHVVDTHRSTNWPMIIGIAIAALLAMFLLGSFENDRPVTGTSSTNDKSVEAPVAPAPKPATP